MLKRLKRVSTTLEIDKRLDVDIKNIEENAKIYATSAGIWQSSSEMLKLLGLLTKFL